MAGASKAPKTDSHKFDWEKKARSRIWATQPKIDQVPGLALLVGTFLYCGLSPFASGTVGSFAAAVLYVIFPGLQNPFGLGVACLVVLAIGIWSAGVVEKALGEQDPGIVVIDEVLGQWLALMTWMYAGNILYVVLAFLFFRAFDIVKVWPAKYFERKEGGTGIMLDDAVAGVYANIAAHLTMVLILHFFPAA